jgi:Holliday junction resolvasome RuvABC endonuclease subunit
MRHDPSYMALDLSLNSTGIAMMLPEDYPTTTYYDKTKKLNDHMDKIMKLVFHIKKLVKKYNFDKVFIEGQSYGSRGRATLSIAQLHGVVMYVLRKMHVDYVLIPPTTVKNH